MALTWKASGYRHSVTGRYTQTTPGFPGGEWATDQLSSVYERALTGMAQARVNAHLTVSEIARVDTGLMKALVDSQLSTQGESIQVTFGWFNDNPYYAFYQEFGTQYIEEMHAVYRAYWDIRNNWSAVLGL